MPSDLLDCGPYGVRRAASTTAARSYGLPMTSGGSRVLLVGTHGLINITVPGLPEVDANGINDRGEVVGVAHSGTAPLKARGFSGSREGGASAPARSG